MASRRNGGGFAAAIGLRVCETAVLSDILEASSRRTASLERM